MRLDEIQNRVGTGLWLVFLLAMSYGLAVLFPQLPSEKTLLSNKGIVAGVLAGVGFACSFFFVRSLIFTGQSDLKQMSNADLRSSACRGLTVFVVALVLPFLILMAFGKTAKPGPGADQMFMFLVLPAVASESVALLLLLHILVEGINRLFSLAGEHVAAAAKKHLGPRLEAGRSVWTGSRLKRALDGLLGE